MRRTLIVTGIAGVLLGGVPASASAACADADLTLSSATAARVDKAIVCRVNEERKRNGRKALKVNKSLAKAARAHTSDMAKRGYFDHVSPDGRNPSDRAKKAGYKNGFVGENIGAGPMTANGVMKLWMNSSGHKKNILSKSYKSIGVSGLLGGKYGSLYTQVFGSR